MGFFRACPLLLLPWLACPVGAEPAGPPIDSIIVRAAFVPLPGEQVGSSVSVITRQDIERREASSASEMLRDVPGVALARSGGLGAQTQLRLWGAEANQTLVLIDGVEANDLAGNDEFSFEHLLTFDIDRIEIIRGPQSALWGSDALAGVINVITRRAEHPVEGGVFAEGGALGTTSWGGRLGFASDKGSMALSASHDDTDGTNISRTGSERDGYRNTTAGLNAAWEPSAALRLDLSFRHTNARTQFDGVDFLTGLPHDTDDYSNTQFNYLRAGGRIGFLDNRWTHDLHFGWTGSGTRTFGGGTATGDEAGDKYGVYYQTSYRFAGGAGTTAADNLLTLAVNHELEEFRQRGDVIPPFSPGDPPLDPNQDQRLHTTGIALEYLWRPVTPLSLSAGVRYDASSAFRDVVTYRGTASWQLQETGTRLHASVGTGEKAPTFLDRFGYYANTFLGNPALKPQRSIGWDAGVEQRLAGDRLSLDVTYFRARLTDEINGFFFDSGTGRYTAVNKPGASPRRGVQFAINAPLSTRYAITGSYTYTDAREPDPDAPGNLRREVRRPLHAAALTANGNWLDGRFNLNLNAAYTGDRQDDFFLTFPAERVTLASYTLVNIAATWQIVPTVTFYGRVENALDHGYEDVYGFRTPGRTWRMGLRINFGR